MAQSHRIKDGLIDRTKTLNFSFDGKAFEGHPGDTLASALLANGQKMIARSFKYHRPRGIFSAGSEEPNALVQLGGGAHLEPNSRATTAELFEGLTAGSQNHRGSLKYDFMAVNDLLAPFLTTGFYYKTFMWPKSFWEKIYEPFIRSSAGLGKLSELNDPSTYDKGYLHCDLLIIGAGPSGLCAALEAARAGVKIIIADEDFQLGGRLNAETMYISDQPGSTWAQTALSELATMENVRLMPRTTVYGVYDHGIYGALEKTGDHLPSNDARPRQILWRIFSRHSLLCAGATERPIAFGNNDRPGIMLAASVRTYLNRWGVATGKNVTVFTNNDDGWRTARDLQSAGVCVVAVLDTRPKSSIDLPEIETIYNARIVNTTGRHAIKSITLDNGRKIATDCLAVSGGWNPNVHLTCHQRGRPIWHEELSTFLPGEDIPPGMQVAGAANGDFTLHTALNSAHQAAKKIATELGFKPIKSAPPDAEDEPKEISAFWHVKQSDVRSWIDLQNDVTAKDIEQSHQEGYRAVEHMKRYTTLGMATDQGKTANVLALAVMAEHTGKTISQTGTTIFRPPYTPLTIGAIGGRARGKHYRPFRLTPSHQWAKENGAEFVEVGNWLRAQWFTLPGETHWRESCDREVIATRNSVGICDVTTLGKIDIQGQDAQTFINRIYCNAFGKLAIGKVRYGLMLREDGILMDDGTTARLAENHFLMTTTTAKAIDVYRHLEFCKQVLWPDLDVHLVSATEQFAQYAIAGPNSRKLLQKIIDQGHDISNDAFPFMACGEINICDGIPARLFRISFSGELAYEIAVPSRFGDALWRELMTVGKEFQVVPYGLEALNVMRIEKGHATGAELNGQTTARDLGMGKMVSGKKDSIGAVLSNRPGLNRKEGLCLMGFKPVNHQHQLSGGAHFLEIGAEPTTQNDQGWMTSVAFSPSLGHSIGLGFLNNGTNRKGEKIIAADPLNSRNIEVEVVSPHFIDAKGIRLRS